MTLIDHDHLRGRMTSRPEPPSGASATSSAPATVSRRAFMLGTSAAAVSPIVVADDTASRPAFTIVQDGSRIHLLRNGIIAWTLDPEHFVAAEVGGSNPQVSLRRSPGRDRVALRHARLAGTQFRMDMRLDVNWKRSPTTIVVTFTQQPLRLSGTLDEWLSGHAPVTCRTRQSASILQSKSVPSVSIRPLAKVALTRDWQIAISGDSVVTVTSPEGEVALADHLHIWVNPSDFQRNIVPHVAKRSWMEIRRGSSHWPELIDVTIPPGAALIRDGAGYEVMELETTEESNGRTRSALLMRTRGGSELWRFQPGGNISAGTRGAGLRLRDLQRVVAYDGAQRHAMLLARFLETPQRLDVGAYSLLVQDTDCHPGLEMRAEQDVRTVFNVALKLVEMRLPLEPGLLVVTSDIRDETISVYYDREPCPRKSDSCAIEIAGVDTATVHLPNLRVSIFRPQDMLHLNFLFRNFRLGHRDGDPTLFPILNTTSDPMLDPMLVVTFPPQHVTEQAVVNCDLNQTVALPLNASPSATSRVAFKIPLSYADRGIRCRLESFLDWRDFQMQVVNNAIPEANVPPPLLPPHWSMSPSTAPPDWPPQEQPPWQPQDIIAPPREIDTALALYNGLKPNPAGHMWNLWLSPHDWSTWFHSAQPVALGSSATGDGALTELWHTRLGPYVGADLQARTGEIRPRVEDDLRPNLKTVRAVWVEDYSYSQQPRVSSPPGNTCPGGSCPVSTLDLPEYSQACDIVQLSAELHRVHLTAPSPRAIPYTRVMLSSQGATVSLDGHWNPTAFQPINVDEDEWLQDTIWGREQHSKISLKGYSLPTGHYISYVRERRREFRNAKYGGKTAVLVERYYCEVREPTVKYPSFPPDDAPAIDAQESYATGRRWPFVTATISPPRTPFLQQPYDIIQNHYEPGDPQAFWMIPHIGGVPDCPTGGMPDYSKAFAFTLTLVDVAQNKVTFTLPLLWVNRKVAEVVGQPTPDALNMLVEGYCRTAQTGKCGNGGLSEARLNRQKIAYALEASQRPQPKQDTATETECIITSIELIDAADTSMPRHDVWSPPAPARPLAPKLLWPTVWPLNFYPNIVSACVRLQSAAAIGASDGLKTVQFNDAYRAYGFSTDKKTGRNRREVYLDIPGDKSDKADFTLPGGSSAGLNVPVFAIRHVSRVSGPFGDNSIVVQPALACPTQTPVTAQASNAAVTGSASASFDFDPSSFFGTAAKLLGAVSLGDVIAPIENLLEEFHKVPTLVQQVTNEVNLIQAQVATVSDSIGQVIGAIESLSILKSALVTQVGSLMTNSINSAKALLVTLVGDAQDHASALVDEQLADWRSQLLDALQQAKAKITLDNALMQLGCTAAQSCSDDLMAQARNLYAQTLDYATAVDQSAQNLITSGAWVTDVRGRITQLIHQAQDLVTPVVGEFDELSDLFTSARAILGDVTTLKTGLTNAITQAQGAIAAYRNSQFFANASATLTQAVGRLTSLIDPTAGALNIPKGAIFDPPMAGALSPPHAISDIGIKGVATLAQQAHDALTTVFGPYGALPPLPLDMAGNGAAAVALSALDATKKPLIIQEYWLGANGLLATLAGQMGLPYLPPPQQPPAPSALEDAALAYVQGRVNAVRAAMVQAQLAATQKLIDELSIAQAAMTSVVAPHVDQINVAVATLDQYVASLVDLFDQVLASIPQQLNVTYEWHPEMKDFGPFVASYNGQSTTCDLIVRITKSLTQAPLNAPPTVTGSCSLAHFTLSLLPSLPMISVGFDSLTFESNNGAAPAVSSKIGGVELNSDLSFVSVLHRFFNQDSGPYMEPQADQIVVGYRFPAVSVSLGALNITQLSLDVGVTLPFVNGATRARFAVSERAHPFLITSEIYGGGGFFAVEATAERIVSLEASFEFGAAAWINVAGGLASGIASVMAGIYFMQGDGIARLTGFFDANGSFDVIGLIQLTIDFYLGFTYEDGSAYGEVDVSVEIGFGFFSIDVQLHEEKHVAGSSGSRLAQNLIAPATSAVNAAVLPRIANQAVAQLPSGPTAEQLTNMSMEALRQLWKRRHKTTFTGA